MLLAYITHKSELHKTIDHSKKGSAMNNVPDHSNLEQKIQL